MRCGPCDEETSAAIHSTTPGAFTRTVVATSKPPVASAGSAAQKDGPTLLIRGEVPAVALLIVKTATGWRRKAMPPAVVADPDTAPVSPKLRALLDVAGLVAESGLAVTDEAIDAAKARGATDVEIHDTVLIAAAFCMYNRYVDGLGALTPPDRADYADIGRLIVGLGYVAAIPPVPGAEAGD